jgi:uncharacterized protein YbaA (DUF1428 family)
MQMSWNDLILNDKEYIINTINQAITQHQNMRIFEISTNIFKANKNAISNYMKSINYEFDRKEKIYKEVGANAIIESESTKINTNTYKKIEKRTNAMNDTTSIHQYIDTNKNKTYDITQTTIRIDKDLKNRLDAFAKKNTSINKKILYSIALELFLDKFD